MDFDIVFEAPSGTLFLFNRLWVRILSAKGDEVVVPLIDFIAFLLHLRRHPATLARLKISPAVLDDAIQSLMALANSDSQVTARVPPV